MSDSAENRTGYKHTILLVEDDTANARLISHLLTSAGYLTATAWDGAGAMEILDEKAPDILLLDIMLPDISGLELLSNLKSTPRFQHIPVLILSGVDEVASKVDCLDAGAEDYIVKPINKQELYARVRVAIRKQESENRLKADLYTAHHKSITDNLTGLYNRHHLNEIIEKEIHGSKRYGGIFSLLIADVDFFKSINDTFGHLSGDSVLRELAAILKKHTRVSDVVARYGGEEFVVILPHTDIVSAINTAEKLRQSVESYGFSMVDGKTITISIGLTSFNPETDTDMNCIIKRADDALYKAKQTGRNRVVHTRQGEDAT